MKLHWQETEEEKALFEYIERLEDCIGSIASEFFDIKDNGDYYSESFAHYENLAQLVNRTLASRPTTREADLANQWGLDDAEMQEGEWVGDEGAR